MHTSRQPNTGPVGICRDPLALITQRLKKQWAAQQERCAHATLMQERPSTKRDGKCPKLTHNTQASYGAQTLKTCPGGGARGNRFTTANILRMGDATKTETGCRLATKAEHRRLQYSAKNANTTQGNYSATHLHS